MGARYRPPALRALASGGSPPDDNNPSVVTPGETSSLAPTNLPAGFRRPRAGTLPSNVHLVAQRLSTTPSADSLLDQAQRQAPIAPQPTSLARPILRHSSTTVAPPIPPPTLTERNSRLRSGSLTLPSGGLSNAFGPSIFSSSWLSSSNGTGSKYPVLDDLRSVASIDSGDDFDVHTLDYLGLDDSQRPPPAATISELRNQAQAAIAGNLANPARMRASTVSNPYQRRPAGSNSLMATPAADEEDEYFVEEYSSNLGYEQHLSPYDVSNLQGDYPHSSYLAPQVLRTSTEQFTTNRPRAISVGILDDPLRSLQRRATIADTHVYMNDLGGNTGLGNGLTTPSSILKSESKGAGGRPSVSPSVHFPTSGAGTSTTDLPIGRGASAYLLAPNNQNRSVSPKSEQQSAQIQTPTRSLWIGNLDSSVTSEQLIHVFAPYGAIESLRLLPEKVRPLVLMLDVTQICS